MKTFDTVAKLKLAKLKEGQFVNTGGYFTKGGDGSAEYFIKTAAQASTDGDIIDGLNNHALANGNVAILQIENPAKLTKSGAIEGGDLSPSINALIAAGVKDIQADLKTGVFNTALSAMNNVTIIGLGFSASLFTRSFSTLLVPNFNTGSGFKNLQISGGAAQMIDCPSGTNSQELHRVRLIPTSGFSALVFGDEGGEQIQCSSCIFGSGDTQVAGVAMNTPGLVDSGGAQRHFTDCEGAGNPLMDLSGMNDTFIVNGFSTNGLQFSDDTSKAFISNMRWGVSVTNPTTRVDVRGENINISNQVGLPLDLFCTSSRISTITPDFDIEEKLDGLGNMVSVRGRTYTPTFVGTGSTQPSLGSGTIKGFYSREGNKVTVLIEIVFAADSVTGDGRFNIGVPTEMPLIQSTGQQQFGGTGLVRSTVNMIVGARFFTGTRFFELNGVDTTGARIDVGVGTFTFVAGDRIWFQGEYFV